MLLPTGWVQSKQNPNIIQRFTFFGLVLSVMYDGQKYIGRITHAYKSIPALVLPLTARSWWTAAMAMNSYYQEAWDNHVKSQSMESV